MSTHTWIGEDHPPGWRQVGTIDVADPADTHSARDKGYRIGGIYDGGSGSVAEPCAADIYKDIDGLVWKPRDYGAGFTAYSGEVMIGAIWPGLDDTPRSPWIHALREPIHSCAPLSGVHKDEATARSAVESAWASWLHLAGLKPDPDAYVRRDRG